MAAVWSLLEATDSTAYGDLHPLLSIRGYVDDKRAQYNQQDLFDVTEDCNRVFQNGISVFAVLLASLGFCDASTVQYLNDELLRTNVDLQLSRDWRMVDVDRIVSASNGLTDQSRVQGAMSVLRRLLFAQEYAEFVRTVLIRGTKSNEPLTGIRDSLVNHLLDLFDQPIPDFREIDLAVGDILDIVAFDRFSSALTKAWNFATSLEGKDG
jgi:hypothetical protein